MYCDSSRNSIAYVFDVVTFSLNLLEIVKPLLLTSAISNTPFSGSVRRSLVHVPSCSDPTGVASAVEVQATVVDLESCFKSTTLLFCHGFPTCRPPVSASCCLSRIYGGDAHNFERIEPHSPSI